MRVRRAGTGPGAMSGAWGNIPPPPARMAVVVAAAALSLAAGGASAAHSVTPAFAVPPCAHAAETVGPLGAVGDAACRMRMPLHGSMPLGRRAGAGRAPLLQLHMQERFRPRGARGAGPRRGRGGNERRGGRGGRGRGGRDTFGDGDGGGMSTDYVRGGATAALDDRMDRFLQKELGDGMDWNLGSSGRGRGRGAFGGVFTPRGLGRRNFQDDDEYQGKVQRGRVCARPNVCQTCPCCNPRARRARGAPHGWHRGPLTVHCVPCLQIPRDLHTISDLRVLISTLETVAGVPPEPPTFQAPVALSDPQPRTRPPGDAGSDNDAATAATAPASSGATAVSAGSGDGALGGDARAGAQGGAAGDVEDELGTLKLAELKAVCKDLGLKVGGKKDELVERIRAHRTEAAAQALDAASARQDAPPGPAAAQGAGEEEEETYQWGSDASGDGIWDDAELFGGAGGGLGDGVPVVLGGPEAPWGIIKYRSTRGHPKARWRGRLVEALREGQSNDGGLLVPTVFPDLRALLPTWAELSFAELASEMSKIWMGKEWDADTLSEIFKHETFTSFADLRDPLPVRKVAGHDDTHVLELFHGPTGAPQDSVTIPLACLLGRTSERRKSRATVVSGWTDDLEALSIANACKDAASLAAFFVAPLDLQPTAALESVCAMDKQVAGVQEDGGQTRVVFVPSDRDAVAGIVKEVWQDDTVRRQFLGTSLGGANAAHVLLAVTNYVHAYLQIRPKCDGPIRVALDPGDYTQAAAAYYARLSGVPIEAVVIAVPPDSADNGGTEETSSEAETETDALFPGLERLAFEFCGRDPGRMVQAAASSTDGRGIQDLVASICPPDFKRVGVGQEAEKAAAASTATPLCAEACRALAAGTSSSEGAGAVPLLVVAPRRPGGSVDDGTGPASTMSGSAASPGQRKVLVSSAISIRDYIADELPPYAPLSVPGPQAVAALSHLKRLGPRARDRMQRCKVLDLSDLLMAALDEHVPSLNIKDTCLALSAVADAIKNRLALESASGESTRDGSSRQTSPSVLLRALRKRYASALP